MVITGSSNDYDTGHTAEIYHPDRDTPCVLPDLPHWLEYHTQDGSLMCGGGYTEISCWRWNPDTGAWDELANSLAQARYGHVSWTPADGSGTYLIGGNFYDSQRTSEIVDTDGNIRSSFSLKYKTE